MDRDAERSDDTIQEGSLVIEERMNRRDGLVEYEGTVGGKQADADADRLVNDRANRDAGTSSDAMQAGAAVLAGTGSTAMVDDAASMAGGSTASSDAIPTMSTDNTGANAALADTAESGKLAQVREGMKVLDAAGDEIGTVDYVKVGDPQAVTTAGQETLGDRGVVAAVGSGSGASGGSGVGGVTTGALGIPGVGGDEPDVDEPFRSELLRTGFIKVDGKGWFDKDRYITPDQIAGVSGDTVTLTRHKDALIRE